jgi:hypothetical protein
VPEAVEDPLLGRRREPLSMVATVATAVVAVDLRVGE